MTREECLRAEVCEKCGRSADAWTHEDSIDTFGNLDDTQYTEYRIYSCPCGATISLMMSADFDPKSFDIEIIQRD